MIVNIMSNTSISNKSIIVLSKEELSKLGHDPMPALKAIRLHCIDCVSGVSKVRTCSITKCSSFPFRLGNNPYRSTSTDKDETLSHLSTLGHTPMSPREALQLTCLDCCRGDKKEVSHCSAIGCPSWPFRVGPGPYQKPITEAQKAARRTNLSKSP